MSDQRRPVWLTDKERRIIGLTLTGAAGRFESAGEDEKAKVRWELIDRIAPDASPEPWVTVDDTRRPVRMEPYCTELHGDDAGRDLQVYRAVPLDPEGEQ